MNTIKVFLPTSKFFLYASLFCVTIVLSSTFFPFIGGKYYFFRACVELSLVFLLLSWGFEDTREKIGARFREIRKSPLFLSVIAFTGIVVLASLFSYYPAGSFWSNFERGEGGFQMLHYLLFFGLLALLLDKEEDWRTAFRVSLVAATVMILYGIMAANFSEGFIGPYRDGAGKPLATTTLGRLFSQTARFQGALGNPAYVAPYLMFSVFYALFLMFWKKWQNTILQYVWYVSLAIFFFLFFILSQTRGAFMGIAAAAFVFGVYLLIWGKQLRRRAAIFFVALLLVGAGLFAVRNNETVLKLPGARLLQLDFTEHTAQTRFWTWNSAWQGFKERPILGWGPENFSAVFDKYFDPRHFTPGKNSETWFDRAHSIIFDYLAETGFLGLASFLVMFLIFYWQFFRWRARRVSAKGISATASPVLEGLLFAMPVGYFVQGLILFDVLPIYMNVFLFFAFTSCYFAISDANDATKRANVQ